MKASVTETVKKIVATDKAHEFMRFCIVGVIATAIHYAVYYLLQLTMDGGLWLNMAYTVGYAVSFVFNFFMTTYYTFRSRVSIKKAAGFSGSHLVNYVLQIALFNLFFFFGVHRLLVPLLVFAIAVPTNFTILHWVYGRKS